LDSQQFDELYGQSGASQIKSDDPANPALVSWMDELEADHEYLVFVADYDMSLWTQRCIGQADRVLIIADPQEDPTPSAVEQMLSQTEVPVRTELVLWHPAETERPQGTSAWLDTHDVHTHHHVRRSDVAHMERLARRLTGRAIALVLSGGAARSFAHLGVHKAIEELDIPIDYVGASSMGAVMGASIVTIESNANIMSLSKKFANPEVIFDRTLPLTSIMASEKVTKFTQDAFGNLLIEDQWIPFFCVASNLTTAEQVVFQRGPIWRAVRSSLAIPGVFTPVMDNGDTIVDGGVMDNFPARLMAGYCESDCIIGVNVSPFKDKKRNYDFDTNISGWRILFSRINPFAKPLRAPSLTGIILRSIEINSVHRAREDESYIDVMIYPDVKQFGITEYDQFEAITRIGYEAALEPLREWKGKGLPA
jgi:predicted acylesterase/phospholipase RssA